MKRLLVFFLLAPSLLFAAPAPTGVSGTVTHGGSITITGSGFGSKSQAAPLFWDNFEGGSNGTVLNGHAPVIGSNWGIDKAPGDGTDGAYSTSMHYGVGSLSGRMYIENAAVNHTYASVGNQTKLFTSYKSYHPATPYTGRFLKMGRIGANVDIHGYTYMGYTGYGSGYYYIFSSGTERMLPPATYSEQVDGSWVRDDYFIEIGSSGTANGKVGIWRNCSEIYTNNAILTRESGGSAYVTTFFLPYYCESGDQLVYVDDVYIDNTLARVEIGNASTWAACTNREIQPATSWATGEVAVTVNQGAFASDATAWVYVVDSDGAVNSSGYEITFGESGDGDTTPSFRNGGLRGGSLR